MKIGFVGCGGFTQGNHIPNVAKNPNMELGAFCDLNEAYLEMLHKNYKEAYITTDMEKVFADKDIGMVICGTKPDFRLPVMKLAVKYKKPLFVEKPLCYKEDETLPMVELMKNSGVKFMIGFNRPYSPMMQDVKKLYKKHRKGNTTIIYRIIGEAQLWPFHHYDAVVNKKESTILHETTHIFDLINWLTESFPINVYTAGSGNLDNVITLEYPGDVTAVIISGDNSSAGVPKERLEINTNYGTIIGNHFIELNAFGFENLETFRQTYDYTIAGKIFNTSFAEADQKHKVWRKSITPEQIEKGYYYETQVKVDKGHYGELEYFRNCITSDIKSETDVIKGAVANLIAWDAIKSWQKKVSIHVNYSNI